METGDGHLTILVASQFLLVIIELCTSLLQLPFQTLSLDNYIT